MAKRIEFWTGKKAKCTVTERAQECATFWLNRSSYGEKGTRKMRESFAIAVLNAELQMIQRSKRIVKGATDKNS